MALVEISTFNLRDEVEEAGFLRADHHVQTEVYSPRPGFLRRTTARSEAGGWLVITLWRSAEDADDLARADLAEFDRLIDEGTIVTRRYTTLD